MAGQYPRDRENTSDRSRGIGSSRRTREPRGQTTVLGIVLLVFLVVVGSIGVVVLGSTALESQQAAIEDEHAQQSMLEVAHVAETSTIDGGEPSAVAFETFDEGHVERRDDGHVRVVNASDPNDVFYEESLGTLAYATDDTDIAYQGGGLWRHDGETTVSLSAPSLEVRDDRLRFPIVRLTGDAFRSDSFDGTVRRSAPPTTVGPRDRDPAGLAHAERVRIEIESEYCDGWETEVEDAVPDGIVERCAADRADRLQFVFEVSPTPAGVDGAVIAEEIDVHPSAPAIDGDVRARTVDEEKVNGTVYDVGYDRSSVDDRIDDAIAECEAFEDLEREISDPGRHCTDELTGTHEFDTSDGDITVVVRDSIGDPNYQDDLRVEGDNEVTILVDGDVRVRGSAQVGNESDPSLLRLLVSSKGEVTTANGGPELAALVYAPDSDVSLEGNPTLEGSVVADRAAIGNINPGAVTQRAELDDVAVRTGPGPQFRSADVTAYELAVEE